MARIARRILPWAIVLAILAIGYFYARDYIRKHPQDVPWTALRLDDPIGYFTLRKLTALVDEPAQCRLLLRLSEAGYEPVPPRSAGPDCGYGNGLRLSSADGEAGFRPAGVVTSCPVAATMVVLERQIIQPAAREHFGSRVTRIDHAGSYSCRRLYGRVEGRFSEHATANAIDITGFEFADGTRISVLGDWDGGGAKSAFLRDVRDGACDLFATALSPDYNAAHADHLHFDQAERGRSGWSLCR